MHFSYEREKNRKMNTVTLNHGLMQDKRLLQPQEDKIILKSFTRVKRLRRVEPHSCTVLFFLTILDFFFFLQGAFWGLVIGLFIGLTRFTWQSLYKNYPCGEAHKSELPDIITKVHYLHFGMILFAISIVVTVAISLFTAPIDDVHVSQFL